MNDEQTHQRNLQSLRKIAESHPNPDTAILLQSIASAFAEPIVVGVFVEGGIVQGIRANRSLNAFVCDDDVFQNCNGKIDCGSCDSKEQISYREDHEAHRAYYAQYIALPEPVL